MIILVLYVPLCWASAQGILGHAVKPPCPFLIPLYSQLFFNILFLLSWILRSALKSAILIARGCSQSGLCVCQSRGSVCLASLMSTAAPLNMVLAFSHINVAEELFLTGSLHACMHYSCTLIHIHKKTHTHTHCSLCLIIALKAHEQAQKQTKNLHPLMYMHTSVTVTYKHTCRPHIVLKDKPQISSGFSQHTLNILVVDMLQALRSSAQVVPPQHKRL